MLTFRLFGTFAIEDNIGADRRPKLMKSRAILAILAATPGHRRSRSWLTGLLWPDRQPEQAQSSFRSALADIRRHLGAHADILQADRSDVTLDVTRITTDLDSETAPRRDFLEGFQIGHAVAFDAWLAETRARLTPNTRPTATIALVPADTAPSEIDRLYLGSMSPPGQTMTQMQADALVDNVGKSAEDLGLAETLDGRGIAVTQEDYFNKARETGCSLLLLSESAETTMGSMIRLKVLEPVAKRLVWSKTLTNNRLIQLEDPATITAVAELIDVLAEKKVRQFDWHTDHLQPAVIGMAGVKHMFRLGPQNFETAETLLKLAYERDPRAVYLAWRAYLRTFFIGEIEFGCKETVIEEGTALSRRAIEKDPHNSMVLAACAHVENMLQNSHHNAYELASRALGINRTNPLAWSTLGVASAFLGDAKEGKRLSKVGARLSEQAWYNPQLEILASSASLVDGDIAGAEMHAQNSAMRSPSYAPPLRFLSAIYHYTGDQDRALEVEMRLRTREPGFNVGQLKDDGYPAETVRKAGLLKALPKHEI